MMLGGTLHVFATSKKNFPCMNKDCFDHQPMFYKSEGSMRYHYRTVHDNCPKIKVIYPSNPLWKLRPDAQEIQRLRAEDHQTTQVLEESPVAPSDEESTVSSSNEKNTVPPSSDEEGGISIAAPSSISEKADAIQSKIEMVGMMTLVQMKEFFKCCRTTTGNLISIIDAIMKLKGCSQDQAGKIFRRILASSSNIFGRTVKSHQFPGARQRPTPVTDFTTLVKILALVPGAEGAAIRSQQANLAARAREHGLHIQDSDEDRNLAINTASEKADAIQSKIEMVGMMTLVQMKEFFKCCRTTLDNLISIIDAIMKLKGCSRDQAGKIFRRIQTNSSDNFVRCFQKVRFPGSAQSKTPVTDFTTLIRILALVPGPEGAAIRSQQANLAARANAGDADLRDAIEARGEALSAADQTALLQNQPSSEKAAVEREAKAEAEAEAKLPRIACDPTYLRELVEMQAPGMSQTDRQLEIRWEMCGEDRVAFMGAMLDLGAKWLAAKAASIHLEIANNDLSTSATRKQTAEKVAIVEIKGVTEAVAARLEAATAAAQAKLEAEAAIAHEHLRTAQKSRSYKRKHEKMQLVKGTSDAKASQSHAKVAEVDEKVALIRLAELEAKLERGQKRQKRGPHLLLPHARRKVESYFGTCMSKKCEAPACGNYVCAVSCYILGPDDFRVEAGETAADANARLRVVCPSHDASVAFPVLSKYQLPKERVEVLLYRQGFTTTLIECAGCGSGCAGLTVHEAVVMHILAEANNGTRALTNLDLGCSQSNISMGAQHLGTFRQNAGVPYVSKTSMSKAAARKAATALRSLSKRAAKRCPVKRAELVQQRTDAAPIVLVQPEIAFAGSGVPMQA
jgi:hypothetical protein